MTNQPNSTIFILMTKPEFGWLGFLNFFLKAKVMPFPTEDNKGCKNA